MTRRTPQTTTENSDLKAKLSALPSSQLVDLLLNLSTISAENTKHIYTLLQAPNSAMTAFRLALKKDIEDACEEAELEVGSKYHLRDLATPVVSVVQHMFANLPNVSEIDKLRCICMLGHALKEIDPEGKIYDFDGEQVLMEMDDMVCEILDTVDTSSGDMKEVLEDILSLFVEKSWKHLQDYGLFEDLKLTAGFTAKALLAKPGLESNDETSEPPSKRIKPTNAA